MNCIPLYTLLQSHDESLIISIDLYEKIFIKEVLAEQSYFGEIPFPKISLNCLLSHAK